MYRECVCDFWPGNFCWPIGKRKARKKGKWSRKEGKLKKGRWKIENGRKSYKISLFKTTEIFWVNQNGLEKAFHARKKIRKNDLCPLWKIFLWKIYGRWVIVPVPSDLAWLFSKICAHYHCHVIHHMIYMRDLSPRGKSNSRLTKLLGRLSSEVQ